MKGLFIAVLGLSPVVALGLLLLQSTGSKAWGLCSNGGLSSCSAACGILVSRPGTEPVSPELEGRFLTTGPPGKSLVPHFPIRAPSCWASPTQISVQRSFWNDQSKKTQIWKIHTHKSDLVTSLLEACQWLFTFHFMKTQFMSSLMDPPFCPGTQRRAGPSPSSGSS